ncbi:MAG: hypothetical protein Q9N34_09325 [Aquificota bacterium]|nr:hypothetical protein [Aquificota bacterium]
MSVFQNTGDFSYLGSLLFPEKKHVFLKASFKIEINQRPTQEIAEIQKLTPSSVYAKPLIDEIRKIGERRHLEDRYISRAEFFLVRGQYLKAIILINEAFLIRLYQIAGIDRKIGYKDWKDINLKEILDSTEDREKLEVFRLLRNMVVHSSEPEGPHAGRVKDMLMNEERLRDFLREMISLYNKLSLRR